MTTAVRALEANTPEGTFTRPTTDEVIAAIVSEAGCTANKAAGFLGAVLRWVAWSRAYNYADHFIPQEDLSLYHGIMCAVMADDAVSKPGSAHNLVERMVLDPGSGEVALLHTFQEVDGQVFCTARTCVSVVR